jgi:hypothetical protein
VSRRRPRVPESPDPRKLSPAQAQTARMLGPLEGSRIPGGCDYCDAYQTVEPAAAGVWMCNVHHDDWCPWLGAQKREEP